MKTLCSIPSPQTGVSKGFSLIEVLTSMTILIFMMGAAAMMLSQTQKVWTSTWSRAAHFRDARLAFELMTRNLSQSTLNTYWDYVYDSKGKPMDYQRKSELHFYTDQASEVISGEGAPAHAIFFQAVLGYTRVEEFSQLDTLLNARGYFIQFRNDDFQKPRFLRTTENQAPAQWRYRLMEFLPPTENNLVYRSDWMNRENGSPMKDWFTTDLINEYSRPVVDNVVALILSPQTSPDSKSVTDNTCRIAPNYSYDSRDPSRPETLNLLPPLVKVTLVAIDEPSANLLQEEFGVLPPDLIDQKWFQEARDYDKDIQELESAFAERNLTYRIFTTTVAIRSAKWSL